MKKTKQYLQELVSEVAASCSVLGAQVSAIVDNTRADFVYGIANAELGIPMTVDTIVQVGSVTKVVNAAVIMTLVEEGKLSLDTPVAKYIPSFKISDKRAQEAVTLRHLLSMSSGLDNGPYSDHGGGDDALARYVASLHDLPQHFPPEHGFGYSNAGTSIAGYAAELVAGERWDTLVKKRIFDPAGLKYAATLGEDLPFHRVSVGHMLAEKGQDAEVIRPWYSTRAQGPAGSTLAMSAQDLAEFGRLFVNGGKAANGNRVLSETSVQTMMTPMTDVPVDMPWMSVGTKWGLGPSMGHWDDTIVWGHAGSNQSGTSHLVWLPEKRGVLAFVMNTPAAVGAFTLQIFDDFRNAVFGARSAKPVKHESPIYLGNLKRFVGTYARYGTRYEITENAGRLHFKEINFGHGLPHEIKGVIADGPLSPCGGDRFMTPIPYHPMKDVPVAFFGDDGHGRAVNLVAPIFAARRAE